MYNEELKSLISRYNREVTDLTEDELSIRELSNKQLAPLLSENTDISIVVLQVSRFYPASPCLSIINTLVLI